MFSPHSRRYGCRRAETGRRDHRSSREGRCHPRRGRGPSHLEQGGCGDGANLRLVQMQGTHGSDPGQSPLMGGDGVVHGGADRGGDGFLQVENHVFLGQIVEKRQIVGVREPSEKESSREQQKANPMIRRGSLGRKRNRFIETLLNCARKNFCRGDTGQPPGREKHPKKKKRNDGFYGLFYHKFIFFKER